VKEVEKFRKIDKESGVAFVGFFAKGAVRTATPM
jgi:hypothetical protein